jgi:3-hydroxyisobutyrate dehydrogenase
MNISPAHTRVGWIGTGIMGRSMCGHLLNKGWRVTVFTRSKQKAADLLDRGAEWADSPKDVAERSDVVVTMVGFPQDVRDVYFGTQGIFGGARDGMLLIDMTTTAPALAQKIHAAARSRGSLAVDAPVSGGDVGAREATLSIMVGGDADAVEAARPVFEALGKTIIHQGGPGAGQHAKLCNQIVIAGTMIGVCESLVYGAKAGLDLETMLRSVSGGAASCWTLTNLAPRMIARNFAPGFLVDHFVKDMGLALEEAARMSLTLPGLALVHDLYQSVQAMGHGKSGTHALLLALEKNAGMQKQK